MSRIGKKPINISQGVDIKIEHNIIKVSKGNLVLEQEFDPSIKVEYDGKQNIIQVSRPTDNKNHRALHGLYRSLINNMVVGITDGFSKKLQIVGVGYRAELKGKNLQLALGYSHPILVKPPSQCFLGFRILWILGEVVPLQFVDLVIVEFLTSVRIPDVTPPFGSNRMVVAPVSGKRRPLPLGFRVSEQRDKVLTL